jgi:hypothetical protein
MLTAVCALNVKSGGDLKSYRVSGLGRHWKQQFWGELAKKYSILEKEKGTNWEVLQSKDFGDVDVK